MKLLFWRRTPPPTFCQGCNSERPACSMNWDSIGQYRCRQCNPHPGPPHEMQQPAQRARSLRYTAAAEGKAKRWRCTECGRRLRKHCWSPSWDNPLSSKIELCDDCVGDDRDLSRWLGMDIVRM